MSRRRPFSVLIAALPVSLLAAGCAGSTGTSGQSGQSGQGRQITCGEVRPVGRLSRDRELGRGIALGPLQIDMLPFLPGRPLKTIVGTVKQLDSSLTLRGWRCSDGVPMRFFYSYGTNQLHIDGVVPGNTPSTRRFAVSSLERAGQASAYFKREPGQHVNYGGYFIFPTAGKYLLRLYAGASEIDSAVIDTSEVAQQ